jgi:hypothetical protein
MSTERRGVAILNIDYREVPGHRELEDENIGNGSTGPFVENDQDKFTA